MGFEVKGHAGFAKSGKDIVCAGVSAITYTAVDGIKTVLSLDADFIEGQDGFMSLWLSAKLTDEDLQKAYIVLATMYEGMKSIQFKYPKNIKIVKREVQ
jgi:uncharacterized protein YsxB (DUF464 family)